MPQSSQALYRGRMTPDALGTAIRTPAPADAPALARVHVQSWRETYTGMVPEEFLGEAALQRRIGFWTRILAGEIPKRLHLAERGGEVIGFASAGPAIGADVDKGHPPARPLHLYSLYLLAAHHGAGIGRALLESVITDEPAQLWVARDNVRAQAFYERQGFVVDGAEYADPAIAGLVEVRMVR